MRQTFVDITPTHTGKLALIRQYICKQEPQTSGYAAICASTC